MLNKNESSTPKICLPVSFVGFEIVENVYNSLNPLDDLEAVSLLISKQFFSFVNQYLSTRVDDDSFLRRVSMQIIFHGQMNMELEKEKQFILIALILHDHSNKDKILIFQKR